MRARFDQLADENFNLKDELGRLKRSIATSAILDGLLEPYASKAFWFMCAYCGVVCAILLSSGFKLAGFQLDSGVLQVLAGSTAVTVIGLVGMVLTGIFVGARKHLTPTMESYVAYFLRPETTLELLKTVLQLVGAVIIAKLTVKWALARFKSEKAWERENAALADLLITLRELQEVNYSRMAEYADEGHYSDEYTRKLSQRHAAAMAKLVSVAAVASLVLPPKVRTAFQEFEERLYRSYQNDEPWIDYLSSQSKDLQQANDALLLAARTHVRD